MIKLVNLPACAVVVACLAVPVFASEPRVVGWDDLAPEPVGYDNPFEQLTPEQLDGLRKLLRLRQAGGSSGNTEESVALRARLEAEGLDVEGLFEQRRNIMEARQKLFTATNDELLGKTVRIPGYLLPLEIKEQKAVEFLLVPTVGACIHTPTPPANQMVHVRYPEGFAIQGLYEPIWISGQLLGENKAETVRYADGEARVETSYAMKADAVEPF